MFKFLCAIALLCITACNQKKPKEYGAVKGSVFWKYNNFVGNRADAGATVTLYSVEDSTISYYTKADLQGVFSFDSIPVGMYGIVIFSENTTASWHDHFQELRFSKAWISKFMNYDVSNIIERNIDKIDRLDSISMSTLFDDKPTSGIDLHKKLKDSLENICHAAINSIPAENRLKMMGFINKFDSKFLSVKKGQTENVVVDFGITYF